MKVKTYKKTIEKLIKLLETYDASTEKFLDDLPTPEKYSILAMAWVVSGNYDDYEEAIYEAERQISSQDLTKYLLKFGYLQFHLQDALKLGWEYFEVIHTDDTGEDDEDEEKLNF